ncbi:helix-turn-helix domain-containing protein [Thomasclavelia cocleata]|uniref:helix-turn-helix domain-containing protein n=2 Tax=Thomasclavelia cocleata TaxID=69824 RepID=UPI00255AF362|nr:HTH domain-containing protein [Thomasclavelia cocleata]
MKTDMEKKDYINAQELSKHLGISTSRAYRIIRQLNDELKEQGYLVIAGRVPTKYFEQRWFSGN